MPPIVHSKFQVISDNLERTKKFYTNLFGWKMEKMSGICQRDYWTFSTTASKKDEKSDGNEQRTVSGEMIKRQMPQEPIMIYVGVGSVTEYSNKVERLGGKVIKQRTEVPGYGWFAVCKD